MINEKYRVHEVAKDLNVPSKDVIDLLGQHFDSPKKHMTALTEEELNLVFEHYTQENQVENFDQYFASREKSQAKAPAKAAKAPAREEEKKSKPLPEKEPPKAETPRAEAKTETPKTVSPKPEAPKAEAPKAEGVGAEAKAAQPQSAPRDKSAPRAEETRPANRPAAQGSHPQQSRPAGDRAAAGERPHQARPAGDRPHGRDQAQQPRDGRPGGFQGNRPAASGDRPQGGRFGDRPAGESRYAGGQGSRDNRPGGFQSRDRDGSRPAGPRPQQSGGRPGDRPGKDSRSDRRSGGPNRGGATQPLKRTAIPQRTNRPMATPAEMTTAAGVDIRHVDMRPSSVDLDKYNERYETIAPENLARKDTGVKKQKFASKSAKKPFMSKRDKEAEKMRRLEMERERRQKLHITLPDELTVGELALKLKIQASEIIKKLMMLGVMASVSDVIDYDTAAMVAIEIGAKVEHEVVVTIEERLFDDSEDKDEDLLERPPVVVVMGHVDHGKTSILDAIRNAHVTDTEAGGITQHIGAYQVTVNGKAITFLDTPGHEAFTAMRARGAQATDIAILVVAADDGIMPQTVEAINHAKAAGLSIIVAINKMDKPAANPDKVKQELTEYGLVPEEWGGDVICVPVSAVTKQGINELLEMVLLTAEVLELKANPNRMAKGTVIEARLDKGRGPVATVLVQNGTLHLGDAVVAGATTGRVRVMINDKHQRVDQAGPSVPVEITGLSEVPSAGDEFNAVADEKLARELVEKRKQEAKEEQFNSYHKVTLDNLFSQIAEGEMKELALIVKADVQGSAEAVKQSLEKISNDEVRVKVIHSGVGAVSKSDVMLANASNAIIIGFNVRPDPIAKEEADLEGVDIRLYRVIYDAIDEVTAAMKGMLSPKYRDVELGRAEIRQVYKISNVGMVAGAYVLEGKITRNAKIRVVRDGIIVADVELASLRRFKDDVKEVAKGYECGMSLVKYADIKEGDIFEAYTTEEYRD